MARKSEDGGRERAREASIMSALVLGQLQSVRCYESVLDVPW